MSYIKGWARKVAVPLILISAMGWLVYVVGYSVLYYERFRFLPPLYISTPTPYWLFLVTGPPLYIFAILHPLTGNSVIGLVTNFFITIYFVCGGVAVWATGDFIKLGDTGVPFHAFTIYQSAGAAFSGCFISIVFLGVYMLLSPFFIINTPECCMNLSEEDRMAFSRRCSEHEAGYTMQFASPTSPNMQQATVTVLDAVMPTSYQPVGGVAAEAKP